MKRNIFIKLNKLIAKVYPTYFIVTLLNLLFDLGQTLMLSYCLTIITFYIEKKSFNILIIYVISFVLISILKSLFKYYRNICKEELSARIDEELMIHSTKIPFSYLESTEFLNMSYKSKMALKEEDCINTVMDALFNILKILISVIIYSVVLLKFNKWILLIMLVCFLVNYLIYKYSDKNSQWFYQENVDINRKYNYYTNVLTDIRYAKDFKNTSIGELLFLKYSRFTDRMVKIYKRYLHNATLIQNSKIVYESIQKFIICILIIMQSRKSKMPLFSMTFIFDTTIGLSVQLLNLFKNLNSFVIGVDLVSSVVKILEIEEEKDFRDQKCENWNELSLENVCFSYPNSTKEALKDISLNIKKGEKICIIGENGSGKSTIIKLLARLYNSTTGTIQLDNLDINKIIDLDYNQIFSFSFQDSQLLPITIKDNLCSDNAIMCRRLYQSFDIEKVISNAPNGEDSYLNSSINKNGIDLSGGEKRKLLIIRCLLKDSDIMVLDEPSSALDINSEKEMYELIDREFQNMTVIYVTHNMYAASYADRIIEMSNGKIAKIDTFENLKRDSSSLLFKLYQQQVELAGGLN